jgi:hypothetical protein
MPHPDSADASDSSHTSEAAARVEAAKGYTDHFRTFMGCRDFPHL